MFRQFKILKLTLPILFVGVLDVKYTNMSLNFVRFYSGSDDVSKFSDDTASRELNEVDDKINKKREDFKQTYEDIEDEMILRLDNCKSLKEADNVAKDLEDKIKRHCSKFLEELREDNWDTKQEIDQSTSTQEAKEKQKSDFDNLQEEIISEGKRISDLLEKLNNEYQSVYDHFEEKDSSSKESTDNKSVSQSDNKKNVETNDKQSPMDYVLEKQDCEMSDIYDSDGGD